MMTKTQLKRKLQHPVALITQGFVAGVLLFWATAPSDGNAQTPVAAIAESRAGH